MGQWIDRLVARLDRTQTWPTGKFKTVSEGLGLWIAFRESERARLRDDHPDWNGDRYYQIDPIAPKISDAFASLLYGRRPGLTPASEADAKRLEEIADENGFPANLQRAVRTSSSEGEVWWRAKVDEDIADVPLVEWYSRSAVYPLWIGPRLAACAFLSRYDTEDIQDTPTAKVYRHFEVHEKGEVVNVLYLGTNSTLGRQVALGSFSETEDLDEEWRHDLPAMLAGRIPNTEGTDATLGVSDYFRIKDMLHDVNEGLTIGAENARKTLKQRMIAPASAFDEEGNLRDVDVWAAESFDNEEQDLSGESKGSPFRVMEYTFEAEKLLAWRRGLAEDALGRIGIMPQFSGAQNPGEGLAESGTALRVRLIPTTAAGEERGQYWDDKRGGLPGILTVLQMLDALPQAEGGLGVNWSDATTAPAVERGSPLPEDETEMIDQNVTAVSGEIRSRQLAVENQHPDWSPEQVQEELARIKKDLQDSRPLTNLFNPPPQGEDGNSGGGQGDEGAEEEDATIPEEEGQPA
jgi:hypothetical protein